MMRNAETSIIIRDVETGAEMRAGEELQKEVWGIPDLDVVPLSHLVAAKTAGGVLLGAFDGDIKEVTVFGRKSTSRASIIRNECSI